MKKLKNILKLLLISAGCLLLVYGISFLVRTLRVKNYDKNISSKNFKITYNGILKSEAEEISKALESNYFRIRNELKDPKHDKISVFIHPNQEEFNTATCLPNSHANGTSRGPLAFHLKYETWYNSIFPQNMAKVAIHEFTHCVQLNILIQDAQSKNTSKDFNSEFEKKFQEKYPQWFWEALSDYEANIVNISSVNYGMKGKPTLQELNKSNQIYNVGYTIIEYFVHKYGKEELPEFIRSYCNFEKVLGVTEKDFENGWKNFIEEKY